MSAAQIRRRHHGLTVLQYSDELSFRETRSFHLLPPSLRDRPTQNRGHLRCARYGVCVMSGLTRECFSRSIRPDHYCPFGKLTATTHCHTPRRDGKLRLSMHRPSTPARLLTCTTPKAQEQCSKLKLSVRTKQTPETNSGLVKTWEGKGILNVHSNLRPLFC